MLALNTFEYIPKEIKKLLRNKNVTTIVNRIEADNSTMCGYFRTGFIDFMLYDKRLTDSTN